LVIEYGNRWGPDGPPTETYSVAHNTERFAPLHQVADALIECLQHEYDVEVIDDLACAQDLTMPRVDAIRAVRLSPPTVGATPLMFVYSDFPGIVLHAGITLDSVHPHCGCDACDDTWEGVADDIEWIVEAIVSGGFREELRSGSHAPWVWHEFRASDGSRMQSGGHELAIDVDPQRAAAVARLETLSGPWAPWSPR
jgi:hypothetical protein